MVFSLTNDSPSVIAEKITAKAVALKQAATAPERELVRSLVARAMLVENPVDRIMERCLITPSIAAILWLDHNGFNRDWDAKVSAEYGAMMSANQWRTTSQSVYALYTTGKLADGSHRLGGQIAAERPLDIYVCLGMTQDDVAALDCGKTRKPADVCKLLGIANAIEKQKLIGGLWSYLAHVGIPSDAVSRVNVNGVAAKIKEHDTMLSRALELGSASSTGADDPVVKDPEAARIAAILMRCGWEEEIVGDLLSEVQTENYTNDASPLSYARERIIAHTKPQGIWDQGSTIAVIIKAIILAKAGVEIPPNARASTRTRALEGAAKHWPDPRLDTGAEQAAAAD